MAGVTIRKGQVWRSKSGAFSVTIKGASGNGHWIAARKNGVSHTIHEGTLRKYYEVVA